MGKPPELPPRAGPVGGVPHRVRKPSTTSAVRTPEAKARGLELPAYQTEGAVAVDLQAAVSGPLLIPPNGGRALVPTGLRVRVPLGFMLGIFSRSGLPLNNGVIVGNGVGVIDHDFTGEVQVILINTDGTHAFTVEPGMRIAQAVLLAIGRLDWEELDDLPPTRRGAGGFGSTGT